MANTSKAKADAIRQIALRIGIETIETRGSDSLDFHNIAVWTLREALEAAYEAGAAAAAQQSAGRTPSRIKPIFNGW